MQRHRDEICNAALKCYEDGADGISTFNCFGHSLYSARTKREGSETRMYRNSTPYKKTELFVHQFLGSPEALHNCLKKEPAMGSWDKEGPGGRPPVLGECSRSAYLF